MYLQFKSSQGEKTGPCGIWRTGNPLKQETPSGNFVGHTKIHPCAKYEARITNYVMCVKKTVPFWGLKTADLDGENGKRRFRPKKP